MGIYEHSCIQHEFPRIIHKFNQELLPPLIYSLHDFCKRSLLFPYCKRTTDWTDYADGLSGLLLPPRGRFYCHWGKVYFCLSPCDGCKTRQGGWCGRLKIPELARGIFRRLQHSWLVRDICIRRKGFFRFLSFSAEAAGTQQAHQRQRHAHNCDRRKKERMAYSRERAIPNH